VPLEIQADDSAHLVLKIFCFWNKKCMFQYL